MRRAKRAKGHHQESQQQQQLEFISGRALQIGSGARRARLSVRANVNTLEEFDVNALKEAPEGLLSKPVSIETVKECSNVALVQRHLQDNYILALFMAKEGWMSSTVQVIPYPPGERITHCVRVFYRWAGRSKLAVLPVNIFALSSIPDNELYDVARLLQIEQERDGRRVLMMPHSLYLPKVLTSVTMAGIEPPYNIYKCTKPSEELWRRASPCLTDKKLWDAFYDLRL